VWQALWQKDRTMSGIYYGLSILAIFIVIHWYIQNDAKRSSEPTTGLLAMKTHAAEGEALPLEPQQDKRSIRFPTRSRRPPSEQKSD
jgi:hypothetical protein